MLRLLASSARSVCRQPCRSLATAVPQTPRRLPKAAIDANSGCKLLHAVAPADHFNLGAVRELFKQSNVPFEASVPDPELRLRVAHFRQTDAEANEPGEVFVFAHGAIVSWGLDKEQIQNVQALLKPAEAGSFRADLVEQESDVMEWREDPLKSVPENQAALSGIEDDVIVLRATAAELPLEKYSVSDAMALSVKLAVCEAHLDEYVEKMADFPDALSKGHAIRLSRSEVLQRTGELLALRHRVNLVADFTDFYWDRPDLERLYDRALLYLDIKARRNQTNERLNYCSELAGLLRSTLSEQHSNRLEWFIIILIAVEVFFEVVKLVH